MIPIIDNGHGGMIAGKYQTNGKQYTFDDQQTIYEGECNRAIKARVIERLHFKNIPYIDLVPEQKDISLGKRVERANNYHKKHDRKTFLISIHSDAGKGHGSSVFVAESGASEKSIQLAKKAKELYIKHFPDSKYRGIKNKKFYIIQNSKMPAILLENFFMDNEKECKEYLLSMEGRDKIADYIVDIIETFLGITT